MRIGRQSSVTGKQQMLRGCRDMRFHQNCKLNGRHEEEYRRLILEWMGTHYTRKQIESAVPQMNWSDLCGLSGYQDPTQPSKKAKHQSAPDAMHPQKQLLRRTLSQRQ